MKQSNNTGNTINEQDDDLQYYHEVIDPKENEETTPSLSEKIKINSLWAFEVYPPGYIDNFHRGVEKLGWLDDNQIYNDFQSTLDHFRYNSSFGGWINIGRIVDEKKYFSGGLVKKAKLPDSIDGINITIHQFSPSTIILVCKFDFKEEDSLLIDQSLRDNYSTYKEKTSNGYAYINVLHQKTHAVHLMRSHLRDICLTWISDNLPGIFSSGFLNTRSPTCELMTFFESTPFKDVHNETTDSFLYILNQERDFNVWHSSELEGLFLSFNNPHQEEQNTLVLSGNINQLLSKKDLSMFGSDHESSVVRYLRFLDKSLSLWVILVLLKAFNGKITILRDLFSKINNDNIYANTTEQIEFENQLLKLHKNLLPCINELKIFCKNIRNFDSDVYKFIPLHSKGKNNTDLFESIRNRILFYIDILQTNETILRGSAQASREIASTKSANNLSTTNLRLQKSMNVMTLVMLFFTLFNVIIVYLESMDKVNYREIWDSIISFIFKIL